MNLFSWACWPLVCLLWKKKFYFFIWVICHFIVWLKEVLFCFVFNNLGTKSLLSILFTDIFPVSQLSFNFLVVSFEPYSYCDLFQFIYTNIQLFFESMILGWLKEFNQFTESRKLILIYFSTLCFYWRSDFQRPLIHHYSSGKI